MGLGDGHRQAVAVPDLAQQRADPGRGRGQHARGLDVGIRLAPVAAMVGLGIALQPMVQPALAGGVVIDADDIRRAGMVAEPQQLRRVDAGAGQIVPQRMTGIDLAAQQIPTEPAALVEKIHQRRHRLGAVVLADVVGLHQLGVWIDAADRPHRQHGATALIDQRLHETAVVLRMRVPDPVQRAEAGRRQRLVDRCVLLDPWIAGRDRGRVVGQLFRKIGRQQAGVPRTAAMMEQADDRGHAEFAQRGQAQVGPAPVGVGQPVRRGALPQNRVAERAHAEGGETLEVRQARGVAVALHLAEILVAYAVDGAFESAPKCHRRGGGTGGVVVHGVCSGVEKASA